MVRALDSHQCGPGSNPRVEGIRGLSLLLVLSFAPRGFSPGTPVFPPSQKPKFSKSSSTRSHCVDAITKSKSLFRETISFKL